MTAKIYNFDKERQKRHVDDTGYDFLANIKLIEFIDVSEPVSLIEEGQITPEGLDRLIKDIGVEIHNKDK